MKYKEYLKSNHWDETKKFLSNIDKRKCWVCESQTNLNVHHLHYKTLGYEDGSEIIYLCRQHHEKLHFFFDDKKRPFITDRDFALACRKLQSMRSKIGLKLPVDKVSQLAKELY